jgi:hypothetical protein
MQNLTVSIPHQLSRSEAKRRIQQQLAEMRQQQGVLFQNLQETWEEDRLVFSVLIMEQAISGTLDVEEQMVFVEVALPWLFAMLAGSIRQQVEQHGRNLLTTARTPAQG